MNNETKFAITAVICLCLFGAVASIADAYKQVEKSKYECDKKK